MRSTPEPKHEIVIHPAITGRPPEHMTAAEREEFPPMLEDFDLASSTIAMSMSRRGGEDAHRELNHRQYVSLRADTARVSLYAFASEPGTGTFTIETTNPETIAFLRQIEEARIATGSRDGDGTGPASRPTPGTGLPYT